MEYKCDKCLREEERGDEETGEEEEGAQNDDGG